MVACTYFMISRKIEWYKTASIISAMFFGLLGIGKIFELMIDPVFIWFYYLGCFPFAVLLLAGGVVWLDKVLEDPEAK